QIDPLVVFFWCPFYRVHFIWSFVSSFLQLPPLPEIAGELLNNKVFLPFFHKKSKNQVSHLTIFAFFSYFITENSMRKYQ
ncbi:hypothetical protein L0P73_11255, partial [[Clostridium] innocuum]|uniref:hypothetical protein n=1 Tax=Clostridium innocuum TaxID=1522 RepID=UPI001EDD44D5